MTDLTMHVINAAGLGLFAAAASVPGVAIAQTNQVAAITVVVTAQSQPAPQGVTALRAERVNGQPVAALGIQHNGKTVAAQTGTYLLLRFPATSRAIGFEFSPPGILEPPAGRISLPNGAIGMLRAVNPGTVKIIVKAPIRSAAIPPGNGNPSGTSASNWSGYAINGGPYTSITGQWTVPTVSGDAGNASTSWIGIDGYGNNSLIQVGTEQDWNSGILGIGQGGSYYAWWEVLPAPHTQLPYNVFPGDQMYAEITRTNAATNTWSITLIDTTLAWTATVQVTYTGPGASAEWIEEAPSSCNDVSCVASLADYGLVNFDDEYDESENGGGRNLVPSESINMVQGNVTVSWPSNPGCAGFNLAFGGTMPSPPGCTSGGGGCSTKHCSPPLVCCDCTIAVCTTQANCNAMCKK